MSSKDDHEKGPGEVDGTHEDGKEPPPPGSSKEHPPATSTFKNPNFLGADLALTPKTLGKGAIPLSDRGKSTMEWMKDQSKESLIHSPSTTEITPEELTKHNTKQDCWMVLGGHVYNVTSYIRYHPGGANEIMKGAGIDATSLFNSIHRYVNYQTILKGKQVGVFSLRKKSSRASSGITREELQALGLKAESSQPNSGFASGTCCLMEDPFDMHPTTRFRETDDSIFFKVRLKNLKHSKEHWSIGVLDRERLLLKVVTKPPDVWVSHIKLTEPLIEDRIQVKFSCQFADMLLMLKKPTQRRWLKLGTEWYDNNEIEDSRQVLEDMHPARIRFRDTVSHNMYFIAVEVRESAVIGVPLGFDVKVRINEIARRYTPIDLLFREKWAVKGTSVGSPGEARQMIYLMFKYYPDGELTPLMKELPLDVEDSLTIGCSTGNLDTEFFLGVDAHIFLAAGSGITPFIRIIKYFLEHNIALGVSNVALYCWFSEEREIVYKSEFESLQKEISWFSYEAILTRPTKSWTGLTGRISADVLKACLAKTPGLEKKRAKVMTCGSDGFNTSALETVPTLGYSPDDIFVFLG